MDASSYAIELGLAQSRSVASRVEVERRRLAALEPAQPGGGNHRGVVGRERQRRHEDRQALALAALGRVAAQPAVGRHAAGDADAARAEPARRLERAIDAASRRRRAESSRRSRRPPARSSGPASVGTASPAATGTPRCCRWRTTAVLRPEKLNSARCRAPAGTRAAARSGGGGLRSACVNRGRGRSHRVVASLARQAIDRRPARIAESQQLRHLVVRLARRVVARPADEPIHARLRHEIQTRVSARHDEDRRRQRDRRRARERSTRCARRGDARRRSACRAPRPRPWRTTTPTSSEPTRPGPLRHRDRVDVRPARRRHPPARARRRRRCRARAGATRSPARRRPTRDESRPATR